MGETLIDLIRGIPHVIWGVILGAAITERVEARRTTQQERRDRRERIYAAEDALLEATDKFHVALEEQRAEPSIPVSYAGHPHHFRTMNQFLVLKRRIEDDTLEQWAKAYSQAANEALRRVRDPDRGHFSEKATEVQSYHWKILNRFQALDRKDKRGIWARLRQWRKGGHGDES